VVRARSKKAGLAPNPHGNKTRERGGSAQVPPKRRGVRVKGEGGGPLLAFRKKSSGGGGGGNWRPNGSLSPWLGDMREKGT